MNYLLFASESAQPEGVAAFGINWQMLLLQAITFLLLVLVLKKFVAGKLYGVIDARKKEINDAVDAADGARAALQEANTQASSIIKTATAQAHDIVASAKTEATQLVLQAEKNATIKANQIVTEAEQRLKGDIEKARKDLLHEAATIIGDVSGKVLGAKLNTTSDAQFIAKELEKLRGK